MVYSVELDGEGQDLTVSAVKFGIECFGRSLFEKYPSHRVEKIKIRVEFEVPPTRSES
ncbi:hypothetical protein [Burkholderia stagnalis]|uniref:hypothetical protein n=1 Tax=Burkholderia stagnalis TaxID=1503054 RepID=UPI0016267647|nr:hypothetical protein [Burkholderia stagnalis]